MRAYGTKEIEKIRSLATRFPVQALLWLAGAVAITGAPPFGLFLSEFTILRAGFHSVSVWAAYIMATLLVVIFIGFLNQFRRMYDEPLADLTPVMLANSRRAQPGKVTPIMRPVSIWCTLPMALALAPLLVFGLWWPAIFWSYFRLIATQLGIGS